MIEEGGDNPVIFGGFLEGGFYPTDADFGFGRRGFGGRPLVGTVPFYHRHVLLCYEKPEVWPPCIEEDNKSGWLPWALSDALENNKSEMKLETRLTLCEGYGGAEPSNGDVLIFPDMIRYRRLTGSDVGVFVEEVLVKGGEWRNPETLKGGSYVFICSHGACDRRAGVCGPPLVTRFREEINSRSLEENVFASPCSYIPGNEYAGNVMIFGYDAATGESSGHWYGYVAPDDVPELIDKHILKGQIVDRIWRGQMGSSKEDQKNAQERRINSASAKRKRVTDSDDDEVMAMHT